jgi:predicted RNA binding protein YcfA (HicA-like mRNA interferase family)
MILAMKSAHLIRELSQQGWKLVRVRGSHHVFAHPVRRGRIVVPNPKKDSGVGLIAATRRQASEE